MSRRRGEFEHRTSIFEGAFRAWSHLGGLDPVDLENKGAADLDPLTNPIERDTRLPHQAAKSYNPDGSTRREYPYEALPRAGLSHPYVQAILSPWLGPDADNEAIQLGLTTLRTWWQHRRKGESGSAMAALGTEKMKGVVEGYTRHFFTLAHCLIVNDKEQPPRTLHSKMKELEKMRAKKNKKRVREDGSAAGSSAAPSTVDGSLVATIAADLTDANLTPLERLHLAQRRQMEQNGGMVESTMPGGMTGVLLGGAAPSAGGSSSIASSITPGQACGANDLLGGMVIPIINMKGKCLPGKVDLPEVVEAVNRQATQLAHRGGTQPPPVTSNAGQGPAPPQPAIVYGDPNTTPVVFLSGNGYLQIAMSVDGITCAHCVKIVETVLKGCNGNKSPIEGLLDAAADRDLCQVLIRIDKASNAKRIAFEAARNLAMVGYTAKAKEMSIVGQGADKKVTMDLGALSTAFEVVAQAETNDVFDWSIPCTCPDNGVLRADCARHSQMNKAIFEAFEAREKQVKDYMVGCGMRIGMDCTCGPDCRCKGCPIHSPGDGAARSQVLDQMQPPQMQQQQARQQLLEPGQQQQQHGMDDDLFDEPPIHVDQPMEFFGMEPPAPIQVQHHGPPIHIIPGPPNSIQIAPAPIYHNQGGTGGEMSSRLSMRNPSIISYGNGLRHMSMTSETTFGRAMSGLSALSIDWENLEDFDLEVDHSAHINNSGNNNNNTIIMGGPRRSSVRRSYNMGSNGGDSDTPHVTFRV